MWLNAIIGGKIKRKIYYVLLDFIVCLSIASQIDDVISNRKGNIYEEWIKKIRGETNDVELKNTQVKPLIIEKLSLKEEVLEGIYKSVGLKSQRMRENENKIKHHQQAKIELEKLNKQKREKRLAERYLIFDFDFTDYILYLRTLMIMVGSILIIVLTFNIVSDVFWLNTRGEKVSKILQPYMFTEKIDAKEYLKMFDLYLDHENIVDEKYKCTTLLSNLSSTVRSLVENLNPSEPLTNYKTLKDNLSMLYGKNDVGGVAAMRELYLKEIAPNENVLQFYAKLMEICSRSHQKSTVSERYKIVGEKFISCLGKDFPQLMYELLTTYNHKAVNPPWDKLVNKTQSWLDKYNQMPIAVKKISMTCDCINKLGVVNGKGNIIIKCELHNPKEATFKKDFKFKKACYLCKNKGHKKEDCLVKKNNMKIEENIIEIAKSVTGQLKAFDSIRGCFLMNGVKREFLTDSGAFSTIINYDILSSEELLTMRETCARMKSANGDIDSFEGIKRMKIQHGDYEVWMDVFVKKNLGEDVILGMDYLRTSPLTKDIIMSLKKAIDDGSAFTFESEKIKRNNIKNTEEIPCFKVNRIDYHDLKSLRTGIDQEPGAVGRPIPGEL